MDNSANKIVSFISDQRLHNGLRAFPRMYITFALAKIANILPPSAAEILKIPIDDHLKQTTPFSIFCQLLQHLEDENMLVDESSVARWGSTDDCSVQVGELEYALHQASEIFKKSCFFRDPVDVRNYEWHLGALTASLLICSGNRLGGQALPFPSRFYTSRSTDVESDFFSTNTANQNVLWRQRALRTTLPKFGDLRRKTKQAFHTLERFTQCQKESSRIHLALFSFLEWKQAIALLCGRACLDTEKLTDIRRMHMYHATQWALKDRSLFRGFALETFFRRIQGISKNYQQQWILFIQEFIVNW